MNDLQAQYEALKNKDIIHLTHDNVECVVINQMKGDCVFLQRTDDHSKFFHIFYDELCEKDQFLKVSE